MNTKWIAISTLGALGLGAIASSAAGIAQAVELRSADGTVIEGAALSGGITDRGTVHIKASSDHASVVSAVSAADAQSAAASATQSAASPASAQTPASAASAPAAAPQQLSAPSPV